MYLWFSPLDYFLFYMTHWLWLLWRCETLYADQCLFMYDILDIIQHLLLIVQTSKRPCPSSHSFSVLLLHTLSFLYLEGTNISHQQCKLYFLLSCSINLDLQIVRSYPSFFFLFILQHFYMTYFSWYINNFLHYHMLQMMSFLACFQL